MMKKILLLSIILILATSTSALALFFSELGGYDLFKAASSDNMSGPREEAWIADQYGYSVDEIEYTKWDSADVTWTNVEDTSGTTYDSAIYFDFGTSVTPEEGSLPDENPFAFLIKAASGDSITFNDGSSGDVTGSSFLFTNLDLTQYGVIDLDWFRFTKSTDNSGNSGFSIDTISHTSIGYGGDDGGIPPQGVIPEPSTWILLGSGLIALAVYRRKKH